MTARHFLTLLDLSSEELTSLLDRADMLKRVRGTDAHPTMLAGKTVVVLLEKASTRTRLSFEVGISELGANALTLIARDTQLGRGEPISDTARMLSGYAHGVVYRTFGHARVQELADHASIPVINGLTDTYHPCQLLADLMTVREEFGTLDGIKVTWVGDGNNMAHSWIYAAARTGIELRLACPEAYAPDAGIVNEARALGAEVSLHTEMAPALDGVDVVTTDVWTSMGQEAENAVRLRAFADYQVNAQSLALASERAIFLHCLPAHRGEEVTAEVMDGPAARVWREAENRLHAQKALLVHLLGE